MKSKSPIVISSGQNPRIKSLVRLSERRERDQEQSFLVEGLREIARAVEAGYLLKEALWCDEILTDGARQFMGLYERQLLAADCVVISREVFQKLAVRDGSDGILAVFAYKPLSLETIALGRPPFLLLTEDVEKPGNLGAILRTANGAGVNAVLVLNRGVDSYNPNAIRSSLGAVFSTPVVGCSNEQALEYCIEHNIAIVVASPEAAKEFSSIEACEGIAILVGSEANGVSDFWKNKSVTKVAIPMAGQVDSLNVSVAAGIMMYEVRRQRGASKKET